MGLEQLGTRDIPIRTFNRIACFKTPAAYDCDYCISMFHMPHGCCCLEECREHEFCRNCNWRGNGKLDEYYLALIDKEGCVKGVIL